MKEQKKRGRQPRRPFCWLWAPHGKKTIKTTGEWGSTSSAPRPARQDHSSTQVKKCQAIFCRSTLRQATLAHLFAGAVKAGAPEAFTAPAKMEGGKAAGRNAPRGAQPTAGGRSPAISPALPGSPQRGRQGRGGSRGAPTRQHSSTKRRTKRNRRGAQSAKQGGQQAAAAPPEGEPAPAQEGGGVPAEGERTESRAGKPASRREGLPALL